MPQVFSAGWLYLFIIVMVISLVRIIFKLRTIQKEAPLDRPVIKIAPITGKKEQGEKESNEDPAFQEPDDFIRQGKYEAALELLEKLLERYPSSVDREARGKVLFRIGACYSRMAENKEGVTNRLRAVDALGEAVHLFAPVRYRQYYLRALGELAGVYEDLAREKKPIENLTQAARTCETAALAADQGEFFEVESMFWTRAGNAHRLLAQQSDAQANLRRAADVYEKAVKTLEKIESGNTAEQRTKVLKMLGDTCVELAEYFQKPDSLAWAVRSYEKALQIMNVEKSPDEKCILLTSASRGLLQLYDSENSPAHLRRALRYTRDALEIASGEENSIQRGLVLALMGDALTRYAEIKDRPENLERAVKLYETALGIFKDGVEPQERERVKTNLADTVRKLSPEAG